MTKIFRSPISISSSEFLLNLVTLFSPPQAFMTLDNVSDYFFKKIILREKNLFIVSILSQAFGVDYKQSSASYVQARPQVRRSGSNAWGVLDIKNLTNIQSHDR